MKQLPKAKPTDYAVLAVLQLIQPANERELLTETADVAQLSSVKAESLSADLARLLKDGYILLARANRFIVSPKGYFLVEKCLPAKKRDHARLLHLNRQRFL